MPTLTAKCINLNIQGNSVYAILKQLADMAFQNGHIADRQKFLQTLLLREKMHSTGFGSGIAVPHGKSASVQRPFVLFARKSQLVDWKANDGEAVNLLDMPRGAAKRRGCSGSNHRYPVPKNHSSGFYPSAETRRCRPGTCVVKSDLNLIRKWLWRHPYV